MTRNQRSSYNATEHMRSVTTFPSISIPVIALVLWLVPAVPSFAYGVKGVEIVSPSQGAHYVKEPMWFKLKFINQGAAVNNSDGRLRVIFNRYSPEQKKWLPAPPHTLDTNRRGGIDIWPHFEEPGKFRVKARRKALGVHVWTDWSYFSTGPAIKIAPELVRKSFRHPKKIAPPK